MREESNWIQMEAQKPVLGPTVKSTANQVLIDVDFPLIRPAWDYNMAEGSN